MQDSLNKALERQRGKEEEQRAERRREEERQAEQRRAAEMKRAEIATLINEGQQAEDAGQLRNALERYLSLLERVEPVGDQDRAVRQHIINIVRRLNPTP